MGPLLSGAPNELASWRRGTTATTGVQGENDAGEEGLRGGRRQRGTRRSAAGGERRERSEG
jgi:hypothetical protein